MTPRTCSASTTTSRPRSTDDRGDCPDDDDRRRHRSCRLGGTLPDPAHPVGRPQRGPSGARSRVDEPDRRVPARAVVGRDRGAGPVHPRAERPLRRLAEPRRRVGRVASGPRGRRTRPLRRRAVGGWRPHRPHAGAPAVCELLGGVRDRRLVRGIDRRHRRRPAAGRRVHGRGPRARRAPAGPGTRVRDARRARRRRPGGRTDPGDPPRLRHDRRDRPRDEAPRARPRERGPDHRDRPRAGRDRARRVRHGPAGPAGRAHVALRPGAAGGARGRRAGGVPARRGRRRPGPHRRLRRRRDRAPEGRAPGGGAAVPARRAQRPLDRPRCPQRALHGVRPRRGDVPRCETARSS